jgi:polyhydroxybutyrate depolymerase
VETPSQSYLVLLALLALGSIGACKGKESLGADCLTPREVCASKPCGDVCSACSTGSVATPDVVGHCGADGVCSMAVPSCGPGATGGQDSSVGASAGCGKAGAVTGAQAGQTITVAGQSRTYVLSVPAGYTGSTPLALVLVWHGANLSGSLARTLFNLESKSNGAAIFVYPDGLPIAGVTGWDLSTGSADFQLFTALVSSISSNYCIDSNRIFSTGHSTGAVMASDLGCSYGDVLRAVAPASGSPPTVGGRAVCTGKVAALIAHGQNDATFSQGQATRDFWIAQNGCTTQTAAWAPESACVEYQGCQSDLPVVWCVHDGGHAWPSLSYGCDADAGICFDGGSAIWAFFSSFH